MTVAVLDETGRPCPLPVIALGRALRGLPPGTVVQLVADDPVVQTDVPAWCDMVGARLLSCERGANGVFKIRIVLPEV